MSLLGRLRATLAGAKTYTPPPARPTSIQTGEVTWTLRPLAAGGLVSVVGESRRQDVLEAVLRDAGPVPPLVVVDYAEEVARAEDLPWFMAAIFREPKNPVDENAIGVWLTIGQVGYLSRETAIDYQPVMAALQEALALRVAPVLRSCVEPTTACSESC